MTDNRLISDFLDTQFSQDELLKRFDNALEDEDIWVDLNETDAAILSHYRTGHYTTAIMQYMYDKRDELIVEYAKTKLCAKKN